MAVLAVLASVPRRAAAQEESRPSYQISATINTAKALVDVQESVTFTNWTGVALGSIVFRLPPAELGGVTLTSITASNQSGEASLANGVLEIPVQPAIQPGQSGRADLNFSVNVPRQAGRLGITAEAIALGNWFATLSVHRGDWDRRPYTDVGDAFFTEVANFQLHIDTLQPLELAFTGILQQHDGTRWTIIAQNVRDVAVVGSTRFSVAQARAGATIVTAYSLGTSAQWLADTAAEMLQWYSARFGVYPYAEFRVAEAGLPASYGGMEYPGLIMLSSQYGPLQRGTAFDVVVAHEVAHQWFYSMVGSDQIADPWLDEGLATYAPALFYQDVAPGVGRTQVQQIGSARGGVPLDSSLYAFDNDSSYFSAIYRPGGRLLHELRTAMGAETFDVALRDFVSIHLHRVATPRAFLDLLQRRTTANLNPIISRYVNYGAFNYPTPQQWSVTLPSPTLSAYADLALDATFPVAGVEVWLDSQQIASQSFSGGSSGTIALDLRGSPTGEHVLQTRIWNDEGAQFENDIRITVQ
jgi:Peptidase family M1 domain